MQSICRGTYKPISSLYSEKMSDLIRALLKPLPEKRPSAEQLLTCSKLEAEVANYLKYVEGLKVKERTESVSSSASGGCGGDGGYASGNVEVRDEQTQL